ncbi:hypothetical protein QF205_10780 [Luteimonas composti]|uniref:ATP-binding protein n=1 Tax=Luteimonas composti TaxID=398257 RepID=A0ABT6MSF0_9GAMM|nr:hypothetical protein [Luteimonas composti]MDH7453546.1 hypothetical protein [Luteimonas composti]
MITVIYGPQASGKTRNAEALKRHYGCRRIVDDAFHVVRNGVRNGVGDVKLRSGDLVLTNDKATAEKLAERGAVVVDINTALRAACGARHH